MELNALIDAIDWPATGALAAWVLAVLALAWRLLRRPVAAARTAQAPQAVAPAPTALELREFMRNVDDELERLRGEVAALREEVAGLKLARGVAPQYGAAMTLAGRGLAAQRIATECGISVAEAELIEALSRKAKS
jgi:hypothetical protein